MDTLNALTRAGLLLVWMFVLLIVGIIIVKLSIMAFSRDKKKKVNTKK